MHSSGKTSTHSADNILDPIPQGDTSYYEGGDTGGSGTETTTPRSAFRRVTIPTVRHNNMVPHYVPSFKYGTKPRLMREPAPSVATASRGMRPVMAINDSLVDLPPAPEEHKAEARRGIISIRDDLKPLFYFNRNSRLEAAENNEETGAMTPSFVSAYNDGAKDEEEEEPLRPEQPLVIDSTEFDDAPPVFQHIVNPQELCREERSGLRDPQSGLAKAECPQRANRLELLRKHAKGRAKSVQRGKWLG